MASTEYAPISFNADEPITDDKMNQLSSNVQWIYENTPRVFYNAHGLKKTGGTKILAGMALAPATRTTLSTVTVYFGTFFSQGCKPIVVATPNTLTVRTRLQTVVSGIGTGYPDHRGAEIKITTDEYASASNLHAVVLPVNWIAVGW